MSMPFPQMNEIPAETVRVARAAFPKGTLAMRLRDEFAEVYQDEAFAHLYPVTGQPSYAPWRLALVTILQYAENFTDRQAAHAVTACIDWKYCLGLALDDPGFDFSLLSEFRTRLVEAKAETLLLDRLLEHCKSRGWLKAGGKQRTDSTYVLARVRSLCNLECVGETLRATLNELAEVAPDWLVQQVEPDWFQRYGHRVENYRLPKAESQRRAEAIRIGQDGEHLLQALEAPSAPQGGSQLPTIEVMRQVWQQYYERRGEQLHWRDGPQAASGEAIIRSPYDTEAQTGKKRETIWFGYKTHYTETCGSAEIDGSEETEGGEPSEDSPHLIVDVQTTPTSVSDWEMTMPIEQQLIDKDLTPRTHLVDMGYVTAAHLLKSKDQNIHLLGPVMPDTTVRAREAKGFDQSQFQIDWQAKQVTCPQGHHNQTWTEGDGDVRISFATAVCAACPVRSDCTKAVTQGRSLRIQPQRAYQALQERRQEQTTQAFGEEYALRAGIEATLSQTVRRSGARQARYDGCAKVHLQQICSAVAINLVRLDTFLSHIPRGTTRLSRFERLAPPCPPPAQEMAS